MVSWLSMSLPSSSSTSVQTPPHLLCRESASQHATVPPLTESAPLLERSEPSSHSVCLARWCTGAPRRGRLPLRGSTTLCRSLLFLCSADALPVCLSLRRSDRHLRHLLVRILARQLASTPPSTETTRSWPRRAEMEPQKASRSEWQNKQSFTEMEGYPRAGRS